MRKILLASVATVAFATSASAYDLIHPFYGPSEGKITSTTSYDYTFRKGENIGFGEAIRQENRAHKWAETLDYGITDNWTVYGEISRAYHKSWEKEYGEKYNKYHTRYNQYGLATSYNLINDGEDFLQVYGGYWQGRFSSSDNDRSHYAMNKGYDVKVKYGHNFDIATPYVELGYSNTLNHGSNNDAAYDVYVGAYEKLAEHVGAELGVRYTKAESSSEEWDLEAKVGYLLTEKVALIANAAYLLDSSVKTDAYRNIWGTSPETDKAFKLGLSLKVDF